MPQGAVQRKSARDVAFQSLSFQPVGACMHVCQHGFSLHAYMYLIVNAFGPAAVVQGRSFLLVSSFCPSKFTRCDAKWPSAHASLNLQHSSQAQALLVEASCHIKPKLCQLRREAHFLKVSFLVFVLGFSKTSLEEI